MIEELFQGQVSSQEITKFLYIESIATLISIKRHGGGLWVLVCSLFCDVFARMERHRLNDAGIA
jgi:hypothetical protein